MRISDWSSDVCSSDLASEKSDAPAVSIQCTTGFMPAEEGRSQANLDRPTQDPPISFRNGSWSLLRRCVAWPHTEPPYRTGTRSEEHTSELQSLMRISYAVLCLKKKNIKHTQKKN